MKRFASFLCVALTMLALGCHAQVPPTNHVVSLSWTAPVASGAWTGCTSSAPCLYIISRASATGSSCPANTGTAYTPLNASNPTSALTYTDPGAAGVQCYIAQTQQTSAGVVSVSGPSNTTGPLTIPANPLAPALATPTVADNVPSILKPPSLDDALPAPQLSAKVEPVRMH